MGTMTEATAIVFDIEKFAVHDGPGIRTVVFLKGCPLRCLWCHNPESQAFDPELFFDASKCMFCGSCVAPCPQSCHSVKDAQHDFDRKQCLSCGLCAKSCPTEALQLVGERMSVAEVMHEVMKDKLFYEHSGGGITLSGGEPLAHFEFTASLLRAAKEAGLHTAIETCGFAPWKQIQSLLSLVDLWLWDVKATPEKHKKLTGVSAEPILANLEKLNQAGASIILRCPLVPGVNDSDDDLRHIAALANGHPQIQRIDLEPYHPLGEGKCLKLGRNYFFRSGFASESDKSRWKQTLASSTKTRIMCTGESYTPKSNPVGSKA